MQNAEYWQGFWRLGTREYPRFVGGALAGITNAPMRKTVRLFSPTTLLYTEICHVDTVVYRDPVRWAPLADERDINMQVTAADALLVEQACERLVAQGITTVDINIGCPARAVVRNGAGSGSALMGDIPRLMSVIAAFRKFLPVPLTVKMRAGYKEYNALAIAHMLEDLGVDALCIHPRLQSQGFTGHVDYQLVAAIKQQATIPVLFSGGIVDLASAQSVYQQTGVDGFLIGRGIIGKPWILHALTEESQDRCYVLPLSTKIQTVIAHLNASTSIYGESRGLGIFKKHLKVYLADLGWERPESIRLLQATSPAYVIDALNEFLASQLMTGFVS